jgi:ABC transporter substrate binding protein
MFGLREWVQAGGLISYGVNFPDIFRRAADYVDGIAKGAKTADLPVEQPTKFELILNLRTAQAIEPVIIAPFVDKFIAPASRKKMVAVLCAEYIAAHCHGRASRPTACPIRWAGACHRQQATKVPMTDFPTRGQSKGLHGCSPHRSTSP